jgi:hypothetical protein
MVALWSFGGPSCGMQAACARESSVVRACVQFRARRGVSLRMSALHGNQRHTRQQSQQQQPRHARRQKIHRICTQKLNAPVLAACGKKEAQEEDSPKTFQNCPYCPPLFLHPRKLCANWTLYVYLCVRSVSLVLKTCRCNHSLELCLTRMW